MPGGARDTATALAGKLGVLVLGLAVQSSLAWVLGPDGRGSYAVCLLFAIVLSTLFSFGVDRAGQYFSASGRLEPNRSVRAMIFLLLIGSLLAVGVGWALLSSGLTFFRKADHSSFLVALGIIPLVSVQNALLMVLGGMRRIAFMAIVSVSSVAVQLAAALVLVLGLRQGVNGALWSVIIAGVVTVAVTLHYMRRTGWLTVCGTAWRDAGRLLSYGLKYYVAKLSTVVHFRVGTLALAFFVSPHEIGLFAAASQLVARLTFVSQAVETAIFSRIAIDSAGRPALVAQSARVTMYIVGVLLCLLLALSWPIVAIVLSPEFLPGVPLVWIVAPGILVRSGSNVLMTFFMATNRPGICSWAVGTGTVVDVAAIVLMLPMLGLSAAAWALTLGYVSSGAILVASFHRTTGIALTDAWRPRREDVKALRDALRTVLSSLKLRVPLDSQAASRRDRTVGSRREQ